MVSSVPLASANPPLSYAERAKKAQNTKTQQVQRSVSQSTSATAIAPATSSSSAPRAAPIVSPPPISKVSSGPGSSPLRTPTTLPSPSSSSKPPVPHAASIAPELKQNGDVTHPHDSAPSVPSTPKQATAPSTNVWTLRKEQMAARALTRPSQPSNQATAPAPLSAPPPAAQETLTAPSASSSTSASGKSLRSSPSMATSSTNGHPVSSADEDDPFVVKVDRVPSGGNSPLPAIDDTESWPEVGQAMMTPLNGKKEVREEDEKGHEREPSQGHGSRKSEKTKWVPVPPEELQFEGPARNPHVRQRSQNPDRTSHRQPGGPSAAASSSSGQGSQQQSRTHSAAGRRTTPSHTNSVTHSQAQSRTGSVHSSPRHASIRGGARRLPDEHTGPVFGTTRSIRSSATNSPSTFAQPQPLPAEFMPGMRPYINTGISRDSSALSAIPDSAAAEINAHPVFYPPQPHFGVSPYHSPRPAGSPASSPYPLPPVYPSQPGLPGLPPPMPMSGYGTPPYPIYPPYGYPYGQSYMYWHPPPAISSSPMANPQPIDGVPPPTMLARPPPPSESDAVAGYRDIGFVLPPPAERTHPDHGEERGRRARELSFGSIGAGLGEASKSPSPVPKSPGLDVVPEGAALGLDVSGGQPHSQPEAAAETGESKSFTVFSIGLGPGDPAPARIRSRTRTQSRGAATSVSGQTEHPSNDDVDAGPTEDAVVALAESVAVVIDLTETTETKWEFGTTKQDEVAADVGESAVPPPDEAPPFVDPSSAPVGIPGAPFVPIVAPYAVAPPYVPPVTIPTPINGPPGAPSPSAYTSQPPYPAPADEFEVRDYGFGFGRGGPGPVYPQATIPPRDERPFRERRDFQPQGDREPHFGRPRRGSYGQGGYGYERGGERGSYGGRRGRGLGAGYGGRGYHHRGYAGRGGYSARGQHAYVPQPQPQPESNGYYAPASTLTTYIPQPYDYQYPPYSQPLPPQTPTSSTQSAPAPPTPVPQTVITFPLDSTRYWLLGQLEYYLSAQNLAQDFWLRQQMDSRGWIPISLIASFNRVRQMTADPLLVTDVLTLSSLVEVRGSYVRMRTWQQYILPTAAPSHVDENGGPAQDPANAAAGPHPYSHGEHGAASHNHEGEDDEEEDVEFVL